MGGHLIEEKRLLRRNIKTLIDSCSREELFEKSSLIDKKLLQSGFWKKAEIVFLYLSIEGEINTWPLVESALREGKRVFLPRVKGKRMLFHEIIWDKTEFTMKWVKEHGELFRMGSFKGIYEPTDKLPLVDVCNAISVGAIVIVPGIAFDREKRRLGRGGGYYDRFIGFVRENCKVKSIYPLFIGLAFDFQIVKMVPVTGFDQQVDVVITESRVIE